MSMMCVCVCAHRCIYVCYSTSVEVRGPLSKIAPPSTVGSWDQTLVIRSVWQVLLLPAPSCWPRGFKIKLMGEHVCALWGSIPSTLFSNMLIVILK